jgi:spermidine synthase
MASARAVPEIASAAPLPARRDGLRLALISAAFFSSGASALVYQVAWQRILALHSGVGIYSIAMIVGSFMAGLGAGSHLGGVLSTRVRPRQALRLFALLELGIATFGALSCWLYYDVLYLRHQALYGEPWRAALMHFLGLLLPTLLMGMSLPFLVRAFVAGSAGAGRLVGWLYSVNVLGASAGALLTPWVLVRYLGIRGAVTAAVVGNVLAALQTLLLDRLSPPSEDAVDVPPVAAATRTAGHEPAGAWPFALWLALYAASGFCALSLEILWFRIMDVAVKSTAFTFGTVLAIYLLGSGAGSLLGSSLVARVRRPLRLFLLCQCALLAYSAAVILLIAVLPASTPVYGWLLEYWGISGRGDGALGAAARDTAALLRVYGILPLALYGPPTFLMGLSFPILQRAVHDDPRTSGRKVGLLQAANIAGCTVGSLLVGLALLTWVGTTGTVRLLLACGVGFALVGMRYYGARGVFAASAIGLAVLCALTPSQERLWLRLHGRTTPERAFVEEDATAVTGLVADDMDRWGVWVNGKRDSLLPWGGIHTLLGAIPALVHDNPHDIAIIGLGSGDTAWAAGCRPETVRVRVFEICAPQARLLHRLADSPYGFAKLSAFLSDPRYEFKVADGRNTLDAEAATRYDLIELDALRPRSAYSGTLYSVEFFSRCARRLKSGGIMCTWGATPRVVATFPKAFPYVLASHDGSVLMGSNEPLRANTEVWLERLHAARRYFGAPRADEVAAALRQVDLMPAAQETADEEINHDLFPRDEFLSPAARASTP